MPFLYPKKWRKLVMMLGEIDDNTMRVFGLLSMLAGTALLYLIH